MLFSRDSWQLKLIALFAVSSVLFMFYVINYDKISVNNFLNIPVGIPLNSSWCSEFHLKYDLNVTKFHPINNESDFFAYGAYFDDRLPFKMLRINLLRNADHDYKLYCHFFVKNRTESIVMPSYDFFGRQLGLSEVGRYKNRPIGAWAANCYLPPSTVIENFCFIVISTNPRALTILEHMKLRSAFLKILTVNTHRIEKKVKRGLCVRPLFDIDKMYLPGIVEFIEFNFRLGIDLMRIYVIEKLTPEFEKIIKFYQHNILSHEDGTFLKIELINFPIPLKNVLARGQCIAEFDCLYRSMSEVEYLTFHDLDEIIVPVDSENKSMNKIMDEYSIEYPERSAVCFQNVWFPQNYPPNSSMHETGVKLHFADSTWKRDIYGETNTKCIVKPDKLMLSHVHSPLIDLDGTNSFRGIYNPPRAILQHHRVEEKHIKDVSLSRTYNLEASINKSSFSKSKSHHRFIPKNWRYLIENRIKQIGLL